MLGGGLGWPQNGFPEAVQKVVLGEKRFKEAQAAFKAGRTGNRAEPVHLDKLRRELSDKLRREATEDDLYSHLMYPAVFAEFAKHLTQYSDVSVLPTPAFFYGLRRGEEISVEIESGKSLVIRLINVSEPDKDGRRTITFELNGMTREAFIADKKVTPQTKTRPKADLADALQIGAPIPGLVTSIAVTVGQKVAKGDRLMMMEAMKMQTTVTAPVDGVVAELLCVVGETVESKDLLARLRA
jgi:pyruvate carboxylase